MHTAERATAVSAGRVVTAADVKISDLDSNSLILRLHFTINHLSRWLTPIHDQTKLVRSVRRGEPSIKELLLRLRDEELRVFPMIHLIATRNNPDLDKLPPFASSPAQAARDEQANALEVMAEFRRLRQSTCSALRSLSDSAWARVGTSRREHDWQIRSLAEHLAHHDLNVLYEIDVTLDRIGAREGVSQAAKAHLDELLRLVPVTVKK
ncbi:MAG: DinB family protein [Thermomicrobiales bacterium]